MAHALLVSDLHLPAGPSPLRDAFVKFLEGPARAAREVFILGDLFEVWIGDDAGGQDYAAERDALRRLRDAGVGVSFMHGNRDFLVGSAFCRDTGMTLLPDPVRTDLFGVPTLLAHGDVFCTDDVRYQRWRRFSRSGVTRALFSALPLQARERIAGGVRKGTTADMRNKAEAIMDAKDEAVREAFRSYGVDRIIHGHTHRPADHRYDVDGRARMRYVLADWRPGRCEALRVDESGVSRVSLVG